MLTVSCTHRVQLHRNDVVHRTPLVAYVRQQLDACNQALDGTLWGVLQQAVGDRMVLEELERQLHRAR